MSPSRVTLAGMSAVDLPAAAMAAIEALCGPLPADPVADRVADRAVQVLHARAAALSWARQATGSYPAPPVVARRLGEAAAQLCGDSDERDPHTVLIGIAVAAVAEHHASTAA
jgi:hypothetical protein